MVQFFERPESTREKFLGGFGKTFAPSLLEALGSYEKKKMMESENRALGLPEEVRDPRIREMLLSENIRQQRTQGLGSLSNKSPNEFSDEEIIRLSQSDPKTASMLWNMKKERTKTAVEKPSDFEKTYGRKAAERAIKLEEKLPEIKSQLSNIKELEKLSGSLSGIVGAGKALFKTEDAAKFNSIAASTLKPVLEIFNPRGAIPQAKLEWAQKNFQPSAGELKGTIKGKTEALKRLATQAYENAQIEIELLKKYKGQIPAEVQSELDSMLEEQFDQLTGFDRLSQDEKSNVTGKKEEKQKAPTVGQVRVNKKTGERRQWDGNAWLQI